MGKGVFTPGVFQPAVFGAGALGGSGGVTVGFPILRLTLGLRSSNRLSLALEGPGASDPLGPSIFLEDDIGVLFMENSPAALLMESVPAGNRRGLTLRSSSRFSLTMRT